MEYDVRYPLLPSARVAREKRPLTKDELQKYLYRGWVLLECLDGGVVKLVTYLPNKTGDIRLVDKVKCTPSCYEFVRRELQRYADAYKVTKRLLKKRGWKPKKRNIDTNAKDQ